MKNCFHIIATGSKNDQKCLISTDCCQDFAFFIVSYLTQCRKCYFPRDTVVTPNDIVRASKKVTLPHSVWNSAERATFNHTDRKWFFITVVTYFTNKHQHSINRTRFAKLLHHNCHRSDHKSIKLFLSII